MSNVKLGIIGAGKMAGALVRGWISSGLVKGNEVSTQRDGPVLGLIFFVKVLASVPKKDAALLEPLIALGCETTHDNLEVVRQTEVVVLGVKPHIVPLVAEGLKDRGTGQLLVSVAAGE